MLVTSIFPFPTMLLQSIPNKPWFLSVCCTTVKHWEKEILLVPSNFSFSHSVFYLFRELCAIFIKFEIVSANSSSLEESKKIDVWEKVKCCCATLSSADAFNLKRSKIYCMEKDHHESKVFKMY